MAINFDQLPNSKPNAIPPKGPYYALIEKAEMRQPKDEDKRPYLSLAYSLKNKDGVSQGKLFDILSESDSDIPRYKLQRFITALQIPITGSFELKDLAKIVPGKSFIVDVIEDKRSDRPQATVDVFSGEIYYPLSEASAVFGDPTDDTVPFEFNASDAEDVEPIISNTEY